METNTYLLQKNGPLFLISSPSLSANEYFAFPNFKSEPDDVVSTFDVERKGLKKGEWKIKKPAVVKGISKDKWELVVKGEIIERQSV